MPKIPSTTRAHRRRVLCAGYGSRPPVDTTCDLWDFRNPGQRIASCRFCRQHLMFGLIPHSVLPKHAGFCSPCRSERCGGALDAFRCATTIVAAVTQ